MSLQTAREVTATLSDISVLTPTPTTPRVQAPTQAPTLFFH